MCVVVGHFVVVVCCLLAGACRVVLCAWCPRFRWLLYCVVTNCVLALRGVADRCCDVVVKCCALFGFVGCCGVCVECCCMVLPGVVYVLFVVVRCCVSLMWLFVVC